MGSPGFTIQDPRLTDKMLERGISINASDAGVGIHRFEYRWATGSHEGEASPPTGAVGGAIYPDNMVLPYREAQPDTASTLFVRAIDRKGYASAWASKNLLTPVKPRLVAFGDSITSGHRSQNGAMYCNDSTYGYPRYYFKRLQDELPPQWKSTGSGDIYPEYQNKAFSGFTSSKVLTGGADACGVNHTSPLSQASSFLTAPSDRTRTSWNTVVMTVGVNDTNWGDGTGPMVPFVINNFIGQNPVFWPIYRLECWKDSQQVWNGWASSFATTLRTNQSQIYGALVEMDPSIHIIRVGYFSPSGTGPLNGWTDPCGDTVSSMVDRVNELALEQSNANVATVSVRKVMDGRDDRVQVPDPGNGNPLDPNFDASGSWPHPNSAGAAAIADAIPLRK